jgi:SAM-dependent methyltransferase
MESLLLRAGAGKQSRILDVGAGKGLLLAHLSANGWQNLTGVEPSVTGGDPRILACTLEELATRAPTPFDAIAFNQVVEHLEDPVSTIRCAFRLLTPGGSVILTTPNIRTGDKWLRHQLSRAGIVRRPWGYLDAPKHVVLFTPMALKALAARCEARNSLIGTWTRPLGLANFLTGKLRDSMGVGAHCYAILRA